MKERPFFAIPAPPPLVAPPGFADAMRAIGVALDGGQLSLLGDYLARMLAMNEEMNLTSIEDPIEAWEKHIADALTLVPLVPRGASVADVGSGGGLPGIPIAIARPDLAMTLVDSTQKKAAFLRGVADALRLPKIVVRAERAEKLDQRFDVVTARAVARLAVLVPLVAGLARPGGLLLLVKGQRAEEELAEVHLAAHHVSHRETVPTATGRIVVLVKER